MIEEFIQGESLDAFVLHQENISQELIIKFGIQLCDILDYLHHLSPYPILYQDLKPEHIILCGNQLKLIDFGIASLFTGSSNYFQIYGTDGFVAPEVLQGLPTTPAADIYSLGQVLQFLAKYVSPKCNANLLRIISQATATSTAKRFTSAGSLRTALLTAQNNACRISSHLIPHISVIGSRTGAGATHFSISLVSTLNKKGIPSIYMPFHTNDTLSSISHCNLGLKEQDGKFYYQYFRGIPSYGSGVTMSADTNQCIVKDYGTCPKQLSSLESENLIFLILSGSDWDLPATLAFGEKFFLFPQTIFICNFQNKKAARKLADTLGKKVYCFPFDENPFRVTSEKERLISAILHQKGGLTYFSF